MIVRTLIGFMVVDDAQRAIDLSISHAGTRTVLDKTLRRFQGVTSLIVGHLTYWGSRALSTRVLANRADGWPSHSQGHSSGRHSNFFPGCHDCVGLQGHLGRPR